VPPRVPPGRASVGSVRAALVLLELKDFTVAAVASRAHAAARPVPVRKARSAGCRACATAPLRPVKPSATPRHGASWSARRRLLPVPGRSRRGSREASRSGGAPGSPSRTRAGPDASPLLSPQPALAGVQIEPGIPAIAPAGGQDDPSGASNTTAFHRRSAGSDIHQPIGERVAAVTTGQAATTDATRLSDAPLSSRTGKRRRRRPGRGKWSSSRARNRRG